MTSFASLTYINAVKTIISCKGKMNLAMFKAAVAGVQAE